MSGLSLVAAHDELIVYTRYISNDYGWVALTIRDIVVMESHFKKEAKRKEKRMYDMQSE